MLLYSFTCPECRLRIKSNDGIEEGDKIQCPRCDAEFVAKARAHYQPQAVQASERIHPSAPEAMPDVCRVCGVEAETRLVSFKQNIGAFVVRFPSSIDGRLCKSCIHKHYWSMTRTTFFLGWWGTISFIVTPFILVNNTLNYLPCLGMKSVPSGASPRLGMKAIPSGASPPELDEIAIKEIEPHAPALFRQLEEGKALSTVVERIADRADVTPAQVVLYVQAVLQYRARTGETDAVALPSRKSRARSRSRLSTDDDDERGPGRQK